MQKMTQQMYMFAGAQQLSGFPKGYRKLGNFVSNASCSCVARQAPTNRRSRQPKPPAAPSQGPCTVTPPGSGAWRKISNDIRYTTNSKESVHQLSLAQRTVLWSRSILKADVAVCGGWASQSEKQCDLAVSHQTTPNVWFL